MQGLQYQDIVNAQGGSATNAQTGEITTAPVTTINPQPTNPSQGQPVVIQPAQTTGAAPLTLPQPANTITQADSTIAGANQTSKTIQDYLNKLETPKTALDNTQQAYIDRLNQLYGSNVGKAQETANLEDTSGLNTLKKQLADLNGQILTKNAEYVKLRDTTEQNSNLKGSFSAKDTQLARAQAADIGLLQARALGMQGQVQAAQDAVTRAINLKYQGIEEEITAKERQMALIAPLLTQQQAKQAKAQEMMLTDEKERIAEEKQKAKENLNLIFTSGLTNKFVNRNGEFVRASDGKSYSDPTEFFKDAGVRSFEEAYQRGLVGDLTSNLIADRDSVLKLRETYPDAGINITDDFQTAVDKLGLSNKYQRENYIDETPKIQDGYIYNPETRLFEQVATNAPLDANGNPISTKPLSAEASKLLANTDSGLSNINAMAEILQSSGTVKVFTPNAFSQTRKQYFLEADNLVDVIGRMRSGGAITEEEEKRFRGLLPSMKDSQATWVKKLTQLNSLLQGVKKNISGNFNSAGNASASTENQVKGIKESVSRLPLLNMDGSEKTPNVPLIKAYPPNSIGGQCGVWVRKVLNKSGFDYPRVGDTLASKSATVKRYGSRNGKVGDVLITNESKKTGHVAYIIGKTAKGWLLGESNYGLNGKVNYGRVIPFNSPSIIGYLQPKKVS